MKPTFQDLKNDPNYKGLIQVLENEHGQPLPLEIQEVLVDQIFWSEIIPKQHSNWIKVLSTNKDLILSKSATASDYSMFWIQLYTLITECMNYFSPTSVVVTHSKEGANLCSLIQTIKALLSEEEILWIEHERMCLAHVTPSYYRKTLSKKKDDQLVLKDTYNGMSIDELTALLKRVLLSFGGDSNDLAIDICKRIDTDLTNAAITAKKWQEER